MRPPPDNPFIRIIREVIFLSMVNKTVAWFAGLATALGFFASLVSLMAVTQVTVTQALPVSSDHNKTGLILEGAHRILRWGSSHVPIHHSGIHMSLPCFRVLNGWDHHNLSPYRDTLICN